jgi:hypothetical protein
MAVILIPRQKPDMPPNRSKMTPLGNNPALRIVRMIDVTDPVKPMVTKRNVHRLPLSKTGITKPLIIL